MIKLGNVEIDFQRPEDWEYSADPLELKSFGLSIKGDRFAFCHEVSYEGNDSPVDFFEKLAACDQNDLHWQSLCQEIFFKSMYSDETFNVSILTYNDSDDRDSSCALELSLTLVSEEISVDIPKLKRVFGRIKSV